MMIVTFPPSSTTNSIHKPTASTMKLQFFFMILVLLLLLITSPLSEAFAIATQHKHRHRNKIHHQTQLQLNQDSSSSSDLSSTLVKLDQQWQLANVDTNKRVSDSPMGNQGWTKLILKPQESEQQESKANDDGPFTSSTTTMNKDVKDIVNTIFQTASQTMKQKEEEFVYLYEASDNTPSSLILFVGGAGIGQYPHIAYSQLLMNISQRINASILAVPYNSFGGNNGNTMDFNNLDMSSILSGNIDDILKSTGITKSLDHFELAKKTSSKLRRAIIQLEESSSYMGYAPSMPKFYLGHSLGCKLLSISLASMMTGSSGSGSGGVSDIQGIGLMSYNNYSFRDTANMVKSFSKGMIENNGGPSNGGVDGFNTILIDQLLDFAGQAIDMSGLEFTPSPEQMEKILSLKYDEEEIQSKTRLFVFDDDDLDCSEDFVRAACSSGNGGNGSLSISGLEGTHLTPVYLKLSVDDLDIPQEAREFLEASGGANLDDVTGGFREASFGNEEQMMDAAREISDWMLGSEPSRRPHWDSTNERGQQGQRRIAGGIIEPEIE